MVILPSGGPQPADPHKDRQVAESFGVDAERYDRTRPRYPESLVASIVDASPGPDFLDVGCGTGIELRPFQVAGCRMLGVEPDERMAELARAKGFDVEVATFEDWDARDRNFDTVIAATSWHWVDPVAGAAKAARLLRPGGLLAVFWNIGQTPSVLTEAYTAAIQRVMPDSPVKPQPGRSALDGYQTMFDKAAHGIRESGAFSDPRQLPFEWRQTYTREEWLDQLPTHGILTRLPQDKLDDILAAVGTAIDAIGGEFTMDYTTVAVTATRNRPAP